MWLQLVPALLLVLSPACLAGNHYWWMNNPSVFSSGNQGGSKQGLGSTSGGSSYGAPSQNLESQGKYSSVDLVVVPLQIGTVESFWGAAFHLAWP